MIETLLDKIGDWNPQLLRELKRSITSIFPILELQSSRVTPTILLSLVGQGIAIALINLQMTRQLRHLGESETKALLLENAPSQKQRSGIS